MWPNPAMTKGFTERSQQGLVGTDIHRGKHGRQREAPERGRRPKDRTVVSGNCKDSEGEFERATGNEVRPCRSCRAFYAM